MDEIIDHVSKLLKIMNGNKHAKIRHNALFAIKNILYYSATNREIKKNIMKKFGYDNLLEFLEEDNVSIQEQALIIFRILVYKNPEDIEEVFYNCKSKFLKKLEEFLSSPHTSIVSVCLHILCIIASGDFKHKTVVLETQFVKKIAEFLEHKDPKLRKVCIEILNYLVTNTDASVDKKLQKLKDYGVVTKLQTFLESEDEEIRNQVLTIIDKLDRLN